MSKARRCPDFTVDIDVIRNPNKFASNTVEINLKHEKDLLQLDGDIAAPTFPFPHLILNNIVSFDPNNIFRLLYQTFQDDFLCGRLCIEIATEAKRVPAPFYMSVHVTHRFIEAYTGDEKEDKETCAICLDEEDQVLFGLPNCSHEFHIDCIFQWVIKSNTCPICYTVVLEDDDDDNHPYYSETES